MEFAKFVLKAREVYRQRFLKPVGGAGKEVMGGIRRGGGKKGSLRRKKEGTIWN